VPLRGNIPASRKHIIVNHGTLDARNEGLRMRNGYHERTSVQRLYQSSSWDEVIRMKTSFNVAEKEPDLMVCWLSSAGSWL
jgi:hypothetical protein